MIDNRESQDNAHSQARPEESSNNKIADLLVEKQDEDGAGVPSFPEKEVIRISDNVFIHKRPFGEEEPYQLYLQVGHQYFEVGRRTYGETDALWYAKMLTSALNRLIIELTRAEHI